MPLRCTFALNGQSTSFLKCPGVGVMAAFSGHGAGRNNPNATGREDVGPIPRGTYYIVDRQSGGRFGWFYDLWGKYGYGSTDHTQWFMLWNGRTGDSTYVGRVKRGSFRLHPVGRMRLSDGCITVMSPPKFAQFADALRKSGADISVPGTTLKAYGTVDVQ
ncbi:DUF2778 domain-containing protein [Trinickia terrae]|uniref:DUF2778 domain-containing protein n=1 Tax=Trinickia terrae TaxID=2571161 RepID=A0A4U1HH51_9BURK|nr:DUF2778 domain-containing protein [Trinickia terrae]TKC80419.1 DUF2778 domain-containing protein [Trinickia terrae]